MRQFLAVNYSKAVPVFCFCLLMMAIAFIPCKADAASSEGEAVLSVISAGELDGKAIETVAIPEAGLQDNFSGIVQGYLNEAKARTDGKITRIVVPDGAYQPHGRALEIYSNTILDLRGSGAETLTTEDDYDNVIIYQTTKESDPLALRCGHQDKYGGDESHGYGFYLNSGRRLRLL